MKAKCYVRAGCLASFVLIAAPAGAQEPQQTKDWSLVVGAGAFFGPEYLGSKDYGFAPGLIAAFEAGPYSVKVTGVTATANLLPFEHVYAGPLLGYGGGRKDVSDRVIRRLPDVDEEIWAGAALGVGYDGLLLTRDSIGLGLEIVHDVLGDSGTTATVSVGYEVPVSERLAVGIDLSATYADDAHADAYYSVTGAGSAASGLARYDADAGLRDVSLDVSSRFAVTESWGVGGAVGGSLLVGSMADSPIVTERGEAASGHGGLFLWYRF